MLYWWDGYSNFVWLVDLLLIILSTTEGKQRQEGGQHQQQLLLFETLLRSMIGHHVLSSLQNQIKKSKILITFTESGEWAAVEKKAHAHEHTPPNSQQSQSVAGRSTRVLESVCSFCCRCDFLLLCFPKLTKALL
jgi:hypothetical protein